MEATDWTITKILPHTVTRELFHKHCLCIDLPRLIILKQAAGRSKDLEAVAELEALWEEIHFPEQARELYPDSPHHRDLSKPDNKDVEPPQ